MLFLPFHSSLHTKIGSSWYSYKLFLPLNLLTLLAKQWLNFISKVGHTKLRAVMHNNYSNNMKTRKKDKLKNRMESKLPVFINKSELFPTIKKTGCKNPGVKQTQKLCRLWCKKFQRKPTSTNKKKAKQTPTKFSNTYTVI